MSLIQYSILSVLQYYPAETLDTCISWKLLDRLRYVSCISDCK